MWNLQIISCTKEKKRSVKKLLIPHHVLLEERGNEEKIVRQKLYLKLNILANFK